MCTKVLSTLKVLNSNKFCRHGNRKNSEKKCQWESNLQQPPHKSVCSLSNNQTTKKKVNKIKQYYICGFVRNDSFYYILLIMNNYSLFNTHMNSNSKQKNIYNKRTQTRGQHLTMVTQLVRRILFSKYSEQIVPREIDNFFQMNKVMVKLYEIFKKHGDHKPSHHQTRILHLLNYSNENHRGMT